MMYFHTSSGESRHAPRAARRETFVPVLVAAALLAAGPAHAQVQDGDVLVVDLVGERVIRVDVDNGGAQEVLPTGGDIPFPRGLTYDGIGFLYLTGQTGTVWRVRSDASGGQQDLIRIGQPLFAPRGLAVEPNPTGTAPNGAVYVAEKPVGFPVNLGTLWKVDPVTGTTTVASQDGFLKFPLGVVREPDGKFLVTEGTTLFPTGVFRVDPEAFDPANSASNQQIVSERGLITQPQRSAIVSGPQTCDQATCSGSGASCSSDAECPGSQTCDGVCSLDGATCNADNVATDCPVPQTTAVYVTDWGRGGVQPVDPSVLCIDATTPFDPDTPEANQSVVTSGGVLTLPVGIAVLDPGDASQSQPTRLLVADADEDLPSIYEVSFDPGDPCPTGPVTVTPVSQDGLFTLPWDLQVVRSLPAFDPVGLYVSDANTSEGFVYYVDRVAGMRTAITPPGLSLVRPSGMALEPQQDPADDRVLVVLDQATGDIHRIGDPKGENGGPTLLQTCRSKACSLDGLACSEDTDCAAQTCVGGTSCSIDGTACSVDADCAAQTCEGLLSGPTGVVVDTTLDLLVVDREAETIVRVNPNEQEPNGNCRQTLIADIDRVLDPLDPLIDPVSVTLASEGQLLVADAGDEANGDVPRIVQVDPVTGGRAALIPPTPPLPPLFGVERDVDGSQLVTGNGDVKLERQLPPNTNPNYITENDSPDLETPRGLAIDADRDVFVVDAGDENPATEDGSIRVVDTLLTPDTSPPVLADAGSFFDPFDVVLDLPPDTPFLDLDADTVVDSRDNCALVANAPSVCSGDDRTPCPTPDTCVEMGLGICEDSLCTGDGTTDCTEPTDPCPGLGLGTCVQLDEDGDERGNACDNCRLTPNVSPVNTQFDQADSDLDGFGDACDPLCDLTGDGAVEAPDFQVLSTFFETGACRILRTSCNDDDDCDQAAGESCSVLLCTTRPCFVDGDCTEGETCSVGACTTSPCILDSDCSASEYCTGGVCLAYTEPCDTAAPDCSGGATCDPSPGDCTGDGLANEADFVQLSVELGEELGPGLDFDEDFISDESDICPDDFDPSVCSLDGSLCELPGPGDPDPCPGQQTCAQPDADQNGLGDACNGALDLDGDDIEDANDNCVGDANDRLCSLDGTPCTFDTDCPSGQVCEQPDEDGDDIGDTCDTCLGQPEPLRCGVTLGVCTTDADCDEMDPNDTCLFFPDLDFDGIQNACDVCPENSDPRRCSEATNTVCRFDSDCPASETCLPQPDQDGDGVGDACDADLDGDFVQDASDNCPMTPNPAATCSTDGFACAVDADCAGMQTCEPIPGGQPDQDGDMVGDACDPCPGDSDTNDEDLDLIHDPCDNCLTTPNPRLCSGSNLACIVDFDCPGVEVCLPQLDTDSDGQGDRCDLDDDGDAIGDSEDLCPLVPDPPSVCGIDVAAACTTNDDCPDVAAQTCDANVCSLDGLPCVDAGDCATGSQDCVQADADRDGDGDACDGCPDIPNAGQFDEDGDTVPSACDNCPEEPNADQFDASLDGVGRACDADYTNDGLVDSPDFLQLSTKFGAVDGVDPEYDPDFDATGDGLIESPEFNLLSIQFGGPPGPGLPECTGEVPVPPLCELP